MRKHKLRSDENSQRALKNKRHKTRATCTVLLDYHVIKFYFYLSDNLNMKMITLKRNCWGTVIYICEQWTRIVNDITLTSFGAYISGVTNQMSFGSHTVGDNLGKSHIFIDQVMYNSDNVHCLKGHSQHFLSTTQGNTACLGIHWMCQWSGLQCYF